MNILRKFAYWYLIVVPALILGLGIASNQLVLVANHGKFPVMMNEIQMEKFCSLADVDPADVPQIPAAACMKGGEMIDPVHSVMGPNSHLKALADIFPLGRNIYSVGDGLIYLGLWLLSFTPYMWLALTIRKVYALLNF
jgi:hypothetical protein